MMGDPNGCLRHAQHLRRGRDVQADHVQAGDSLGLAGRQPAEPRADDGGIDGEDDGEDGIIEEERSVPEEAPRRGALARLFRRRRGSGA